MVPYWISHGCHNRVTLLGQICLKCRMKCKNPNCNSIAKINGLCFTCDIHLSQQSAFKDTFAERLNEPYPFSQDNYLKYIAINASNQIIKEKKMKQKCEKILASTYSELEEAINELIEDNEEYSIERIDYFNMENEKGQCAAFILFSKNKQS